MNVFHLAKSNIVVQHCKLHNDASCNLSQDGTMLATFVPSHRGFPDDNIMAVYSLEPKTRGQCLFTKSFGKYFTLIHVTGECNLQGGYIILVIYVYWNHSVTLSKSFDKILVIHIWSSLNFGDCISLYIVDIMAPRLVTGIDSVPKL